MEVEGHDCSAYVVLTPAFTLAPGESGTLIVAFRPTDAGDHTCLMDLGPNPCDRVELTGNASFDVIDLDADSPTYLQVVATVQDIDPNTKATRFDEPVGIAFASNEKDILAAQLAFHTGEQTDRPKIVGYVNLLMCAVPDLPKMAKGINEVQHRTGQLVNTELALLSVLLALFGVFVLVAAEACVQERENLFQVVVAKRTGFVARAAPATPARPALPSPGPRRPAWNNVSRPP